jgi:phosphatidylserine/phosphatidylglycerophosphate/cardiolipin synthase-like enzyme
MQAHKRELIKAERLTSICHLSGRGARDGARTEKRRYHGVFALLCISALLTIAHAQPATPPSPAWQVYFSPAGGATTAICQALGNARSSILVQAYSFTSAPIADALIRAHKKGVRVQVLLDKSQQQMKYSCIDILMAAGVPLLIDASHAIAHNKVMIIDNEILITGSFNFTKAAEERNAENLLIIHNKDLSAKYLSNWGDHQSHSLPYRRQVGLK